MHHVRLADGFSVWRWFALRGAGFSADRMAPLGSPAYAAEVDRWIARAGALEARLAAALGDREGRARKWQVRAVAALRELGVPDAPAAGLVDPATAAEVDDLRRAREELEHHHRDELARVGQELRATVADPLFREAVAWQNRHALHTGMDVLVRAAPGRADSKTRQHEQLVAGYLQRYATKNDHIGFFGPVGFGTFSREVPAIAFRPGPALLASRHVYFEQWCIAALAHRLSQDPRIARWIAPRLLPTLRVEGNVVHHSSGSDAIPEAFARALAACDGRRPATAIARELVAIEELELADEVEVYDVLEQLEQHGLITWKIAIPGASLELPERWLRAALERIGDDEPRRDALAALDELEAGRAKLAAAAGDPDAVERAATELETTFHRLTGAEATRNAGQTYGGRTLFYEDCRRDVELELGTAVLDRLGPPLGLVLHSARWYTHEIAARYRAAFRALYDELRAGSDAGPVAYVAFAERAGDLFGELRAEHPFVAETVRRLQATWRELLAFDDAERRVQRRAAELAPAVAAAFAAPGPGWPVARFHSPDLAIAAESAEAIARGDFLGVVGEIHVGINTLPSVLALHPDPAPLIEAFERDIPFARVDTVSAARVESRVDAYSPARHDFDVELGASMSHRPREQVIPIGELVVDEQAGELVVRTRDGRQRFDIIAYHERQIATGTAAHFHVLAPAAHLPRVTVDALVISREQWAVDPATLAFAHAKTAPQRFLGARRWAHELSLPRYVFYKIPEETKPMFLDLGSPILIEMFAKQVRKASRLRLSEMLPAIDELWLADAARARYTSELRTVVVDDRPWSAP